MIPPLYEHQQRIINEDKKKCGLFLGTGSAKTRTALELAEGSVLVICPKQQREDRTWERNADKFGIIVNLTVISKEDLRRDWGTLPRYDTVIIDECHNNLGVTAETRQRKGVQIPKTSQIFEATYRYLVNCNPSRLYLCSATPVSKPMNLWALARLFGESWNFFDFRNKYYAEIRMGQRRIWMEREDEATKARMAEIIKRYGYTGGLSDFFDVPEQTHKEVMIDMTPQQAKAVKDLMLAEADPLVRNAKIRTIQNGVLYTKRVERIGDRTEVMRDHTEIFPSNKIEYILERAIEFPKLLIFANYTAQVHQIEKALKAEGYNVSTLTGQTKDRANLILDAENSKAHIVIAQSSISAGYELPSFPCVIFASKSRQAVHYSQALGRVLRSNALKKNLYIHLVVKGKDEDCHKAVMAGEDFYEKVLEQ